MSFQTLSGEPNQPSVDQHMLVNEQANTPKAAFLTVPKKEGDDVQTLLETRIDIQRKKIDELTMDSSKDGPGSPYAVASPKRFVLAMSDTLPDGQRGIKIEQRRVFQSERRA
ncbi:MAG: hypothetical protein JSR39_08585, partial [Verrucomicrobia bacterium]|nr:hypothetical protein [Verrucomicrobiota bacterium]